MNVSKVINKNVFSSNKVTNLIFIEQFIYIFTTFRFQTNIK